MLDGKCLLGSLRVSFPNLHEVLEAAVLQLQLRDMDYFIEKKRKRNGQGLAQQFCDVTQSPGSFPASLPPSLAHRFPFLYASPHRCRTAANPPGAVPSKARAKTFLLLHRLSPFLEFIIVHTLGQPVMKKNIIISSIIIIINWARIAEIAGPRQATWT